MTLYPNLGAPCPVERTAAPPVKHRVPSLRRLLSLARTGAVMLALALASMLLLAPSAYAKGGVAGGVPPAPVGVGPAVLPGGPVPFTIIGAIQSLTVSAANDPYAGGVMMVNGISVTIPRNLVITLPAAYKTVGQLFADSPAPGQSALALNDVPKPLAAYEATMTGNVVGGAYIAGLVSIAQQSLNTTDGYIKSINYTTGELCVGSTPGPLVGLCTLPNTRVVINDPDGRYGLANGVGAKPSPDKRFTVDPDNPTIHASSGYPVCVPRSDPATLVDPRCPITNRLALAAGGFAPIFAMQATPLTPPAAFAGFGTIPACPSCNVNEQAPLVVGDFITYSGILAADAFGTYVAAYALAANVGIWTPPGGPVFYVFIDAPLIGTGPSLCPANAAECKARLKTDIFVTDFTRTPALYAVDETPAGDRTSRQLPSTIINVVVLGRFRVFVDKDTLILGGAAGVTREIIARVAGVADGTPVFYATTPGVPAASVRANGLVSGQYVSPVGDYLFPEGARIPGGVLTPRNFRCLAFLVKGWGQSGGLPGIGQLVPFPEAVAPTPVNCGS